MGDCVICLEPLAPPLRALRCAHSFHEACVDAWMRTDDKQSCPVCRESQLAARAARAAGDADLEDGGVWRRGMDDGAALLTRADLEATVMRTGQQRCALFASEVLVLALMLTERRIDVCVFGALGLLAGACVGRDDLFSAVFGATAVASAQNTLYSVYLLVRHAAAASDAFACAGLAAYELTVLRLLQRARE